MGNMKIILTTLAMLAALALPGRAQELLHKQAPAVPDYVVFAGDTVPTATSAWTAN